MNAERIEERHDMRGKSHAHGHVGDSIFEDQIPADNPGDKLAHRCVRVCVRAAGDRNHGFQLRVTERRETAHNRHEREGQSNGGTRSGPSERRRMIDQIFQQGSIEKRTGFELLPGDGRANNGENSRSDHGADAEGREAQPAEGLLQAFFGIFGVGDELVDALGTEKLWVQSPPSRASRKLYLAGRSHITALNPKVYASWKFAYRSTNFFAPKS